jgi:hypothetical protein
VVEEAKESLKRLYQGRKTVSEYASEFKQFADLTGFSEEDLKDRFLDHLRSDIRMGLVYSPLPQGTFAELEKVAIQLDNRMKGAQRQQTSRNNYFNNNNSFGTFSPPAQRIEATSAIPGRTDDTFRSLMNGRCWGCGSTQHSKAAGNHEGDTCNYCKGKGHRENVCKLKYLGITPRSRAQRVAATFEAPFDIMGISATSSTPTPAQPFQVASIMPAAPVTPSMDMGVIASALTKLMADQKTLAAQLTDIQSRF